MNGVTSEGPHKPSAGTSWCTTGDYSQPPPTLPPSDEPTPPSVLIPPSIPPGTTGLKFNSHQGPWPVLPPSLPPLTFLPLQTCQILSGSGKYPWNGPLYINVQRSLAFRSLGLTMAASSLYHNCRTSSSSSCMDLDKRRRKSPYRTAKRGSPWVTSSLLFLKLNTVSGQWITRSVSRQA